MRDPPGNRSFGNRSFRLLMWAPSIGAESTPGKRARRSRIPSADEQDKQRNRSGWLLATALGRVPSTGWKLSRVLPKFTSVRYLPRSHRESVFLFCSCSWAFYRFQRIWAKSLNPLRLLALARKHSPFPAMPRIALLPEELLDNI